MRPQRGEHHDLAESLDDDQEAKREEDPPSQVPRLPGDDHAPRSHPQQADREDDARARRVGRGGESFTASDSVLFVGHDFWRVCECRVHGRGGIAAKGARRGEHPRLEGVWDHDDLVRVCS